MSFHGVNKDAIVLLILGLLLTWLLTSSVGIIKSQQSPSAQSAGLPRVSLPTLPLPNLYPGFPMINITIVPPTPLITGILTIPLVPIPIIIPNIPINAALPINIPVIRTGTGINTGSLMHGAAQGLSGTKSPVPVSIPFPRVLVIALLVFTLIIAVVMGIISVKNLRGISRSTEASRQQLQTEQWKATKPIARGGGSKAQSAVQYGNLGINLMPNEVVSPLRGWGGSSLVKLPIPTDLPLIWHVGLMTVETGNNVSVSVRPSAPMVGGAIQFLVPGCYELVVDGNGITERWFIRVVDYGEDVIKLMRLNNPGIGASSTVREDLMRFMNRGQVNNSVLRLISTFEKARYGLRPIGRSEYEDYLRSLAKVFPDAKVIVCG